MTTLPATIAWVGEIPGRVRLLDQTLLPGEIRVLERTEAEEVYQDIRRLAVRGAPAIGIAGAYGVALGAQRAEADDGAGVAAEARRIAARLAGARPTAVNLSWALARVVRAAEGAAGGGADAVRSAVLAEARAVHEEDRATCRAIGQHGAPLVPDGGTVLTHCNAGALATGGSGTALAVLFAAWESGKRFSVLAGETRPLWQGARLTALELHSAGIPVTVIADSMAGAAMKAGRVKMVLVGADRIARNGDVANKIGTYGLAVLARAHKVPFYVAAPASTFDLSIKSGAEIPIEERDPAEVLRPGGLAVAPEGVPAWNPAFDVTPARLVTAIVTDRGVIRRATDPAIRRVLGSRRGRGLTPPGNLSATPGLPGSLGLAPKLYL